MNDSEIVSAETVNLVLFARSAQQTGRFTELIAAYSTAREVVHT